MMQPIVLLGLTLWIQRLYAISEFALFGLYQRFGVFCLEGLSLGLQCVPVGQCR